MAPNSPTEIDVTLSRHLRNLNITSETDSDAASTTSGKDSDAAFQTIKDFFQSIDNCTRLAKKVQELDIKFPDGSLLDTRQICSLSSDIRSSAETSHLNDLINNAVDKVVDISASSAVGRLLQWGKGLSNVQSLLTYFNANIARIAQQVVQAWESSNDYILAKIAEECYNATKHRGDLDADNYFISLDGTQPEWPYDPDCEAEAYYEHQDRLDLDENYAKAHYLECARRDESRMQHEQSWPKFWLEVLETCPGGTATLFRPPAMIGPDARSHPSQLSDSTPRYLFRTFDRLSDTHGDKAVIQSKASRLGAESSKTDLLSMDKLAATGMLLRHLKWKSDEGPDCPDNLVSWTSSLLFAIQYAIYRRYTSTGLQFADIRICVVDTAEFQPGQFMRDTTLMGALNHHLGHEHFSWTKFFNFRTTWQDYYNGEYLSQGLTYLTGRSWSASLEGIIKAGLFDLYPEFDEVESRGKWSKRALELRRLWSTEHHTTSREAKSAFSIANQFSTTAVGKDIALLLLCFKNRKEQQPLVIRGKDYTAVDAAQADVGNERDKGMEDPVEVRRYKATRQAMECRAIFGGNWTWLGEQEEYMKEAMAQFCVDSQET